MVRTKKQKNTGVAVGNAIRRFGRGLQRQWKERQLELSTLTAQVRRLEERVAQLEAQQK